MCIPNGPPKYWGFESDLHGHRCEGTHNMCTLGAATSGGVFCPETHHLGTLSGNLYAPPGSLTLRPSVFVSVKRWFGGG